MCTLPMLVFVLFHAMFWSVEARVSQKYFYKVATGKFNFNISLVYFIVYKTSDIHDISDLKFITMLIYKMLNYVTTCFQV
jgi:hypothetical protein